VPRLLTPRWLLWHVVTVAAVVAMVVLGRWQLHRGEQTHSVQNYGYAAQWWCFAAAAGWFWTRTLRDAGQGSARTAPVRVPVAAPTAPAALHLSAEDEADEEVMAYNAMLRRLAEAPRR